jgi:hypothetical protein
MKHSIADIIPQFFFKKSPKKEKEIEETENLICSYELQKLQSTCS